jgi:hypothetical protein
MRNLRERETRNFRERERNVQSLGVTLEIEKNPAIHNIIWRDAAMQIFFEKYFCAHKRKNGRL